MLPWLSPKLLQTDYLSCGSYVRSVFDILAGWLSVHCSSVGVDWMSYLSLHQRSCCQLPTADLQNCLCLLLGQMSSVRRCSDVCT